MLYQLNPNSTAGFVNSPSLFTNVGISRVKTTRISNFFLSFLGVHGPPRTPRSERRMSSSLKMITPRIPKSSKMNSMELNISFLSLGRYYTPSTKSKSTFCHKVSIPVRTREMCLANSDRNRQSRQSCKPRRAGCTVEKEA